MKAVPEGEGRGEEGEEGRQRQRILQGVVCVRTLLDH